MLNVAETCLGADEKAALIDVIESGWITMGERVRTFEEAFATIHGAEDSIALGSCTAALHLIMHCLDLGPGDEVLVPALTFAATPNSVLYVGAKPVFVDIESIETPLMSIEDAAAKCTERTKAIVLVHYAGYLGNREQWQKFAAERNLLLIEDAAHAAGVPEAGTFGIAAAFSFYGNKNMTTAEGGAVITRDAQLGERIRLARSHGLTSGTFQRHGSATKQYDVVALGYNYRMDELRAALGLVQLGKLLAWNEKRRRLTGLYRDILHERVDGAIIPFSPGAKSAHHILPCVLPKGTDRAAVIAKMLASGVQTSVHYPPAHRFTYYLERLPTVSLPKTEDFTSREITLPLHPMVSDADIDTVARALADALA